jgi:hypothetical protein
MVEQWATIFDEFWKQGILQRSNEEFVFIFFFESCLSASNFASTIFLNIFERWTTNFDEFWKQGIMKRQNKIFLRRGQ